MSEKALSDKREIARHNEIKILIVLAQLNNEPLHVARIMREGRRIKSLKPWETARTTIPGLRAALARLEEKVILKSHAAESEIRHRKTVNYQIRPDLDAFAEIANTYGLGVLSFIRSTKFGQLVIVDNLHDYLRRRLSADEDSLRGCSKLIGEITFLAQHSGRSLEVLLYPSPAFDRTLPRTQPERTKAVLTYLRDVMSIAFALDAAVSTRKKLEEEGIKAEFDLTTSARIGVKQIHIESKIRTEWTSENKGSNTT